VLPAVKKLKSETIVAEDPETPLAESNELIPDYAIVEPEEKTSEAKQTSPLLAAKIDIQTKSVYSGIGATTAKKASGIKLNVIS